MMFPDLMMHSVDYCTLVSEVCVKVKLLTPVCLVWSEDAMLFLDLMMQHWSNPEKF